MEVQKCVFEETDLYGNVSNTGWYNGGKRATGACDNETTEALNAHTSSDDYNVEDNLPIGTERDFTDHQAKLYVSVNDAKENECYQKVKVEKFEGNIEPKYYAEENGIPVFMPSVEEFEDFERFVEKVNEYGMKSGIIKVIPPKEWREKLPEFDERMKRIRIRRPISQEFVGTHETFTQANIEKSRTFNVAQWKAITERSSHQPPAGRHKCRSSASSLNLVPLSRLHFSGHGDCCTLSGRGRRQTRKRGSFKGNEFVKDEFNNISDKRRRINSRSPLNQGKKGLEVDGERSAGEAKGNSWVHGDDDNGMTKFNYRLECVDEYTEDRCKELEKVYWKTLNFGEPMYGADIPGSLFDDSTTSWNVGRLKGILNVLTTKISGVNTPYLYFGMWKATFAWHVEDVDLYSINYLHFGAPKQWYSISQVDARRFEAAARRIWPFDAQHCSQFLRHKIYLVSPEKLYNKYGIRVNRIIQRQGEFILTFPYGYHSGYNLGYNCAESVNFATMEWLKTIGPKAEKCNCEADNVWIDVGELRACVERMKKCQGSKDGLIEDLTYSSKNNGKKLD